jgi:ribulose-phosphate 3-epimerase
VNTKHILAPSILSADFTRLGGELAACESAEADWIHVDVMDGHFVPNITMGPFVVEACRRATKLPLDVHLMIENPDRHLEAFAEAGANNITVHVEACSHLQRTLQRIKSLGCKAGVALNPGTLSGAIAAVLHEADQVLVMCVNPGYSGQKFISSTVGKVKEIRGMLEELKSSAWLEVDGGIDAETLPQMKKAGATVFVAATAVFKHPEGAEAGIKSLQSVIASDPEPFD